MIKESLSKKLIFGVFYLLSSSFTSIALNVVIVGFVARKLGVENFGLYSAIYAFVNLFQFLSDLGLNKTLLKFGSTDTAKTQISFGNALFLKTILAIPTLLLISVSGLAAGYKNEEFIILEFFAISLILDSYASVFSSIRRIFGYFKLVSFFRVFKTAINLIIIFIALSFNNSVFSLAYANLILSTVSFVISLINTVFLIRPKINLALIKEFFKDSIIFSFNDFFSKIYSRISIVLLSFFNELHIVGIFSAATRFTRIANLLPAQIKFAFLPTLYRMLDKEKDKSEQLNTKDKKSRSKKLFYTLLKYMGIFATPVAISIFLFSDFIIHIIFGNKYELAIPFVKLFSLFIFLHFIETPFSLFYIAMHKHKYLVQLQGISTFINVVLNLILIPFYSAYGACYATLLSETLFGTILIHTGKKYSIWNNKDVLKTLIKPLCAGFISCILTIILFSEASVIIRMVFLPLSYLFILFLVKTFKKEDKELLKKIFARVKK